MLLQEETKLADVRPYGINIMIKLPDYFKSRERETQSGIYVPHLEGWFEHDMTHGTVVAVGEKVNMCKVGDEVFFSKLCIQNGLQNMGRDKTRPDANKNSPSSAPVFYVADETGHYLFMPEERMYLIASDMSGDHEADIHGGVICAIRNGEVVCMNDYHIIEDAYDKGELIDGVLTKRVGAIHLAVLNEEPEKNKRFKVLYAPVDSVLKTGSIVFTNPHCDIPLEGEFNYPVLPKGCYFVRGSDILGEFTDQAITA